MYTEPDVENLFRRLLKPGPMKRLPKSRDDTEVFLALAAAALDPRADYAETELNDALKDWLAGFTRARTLDHVTVRRFLVDYNFLLRDTPGHHYRANQTVINTVLEPAARSVQPSIICEEIEADRAFRRRVFADNDATA